MNHIENDHNIKDGTQSVQSREAFVVFTKNLLIDFKKDPSHWTNNNLESFLEAMTAYAENIDGYYQNNGFKTSTNIPTWRIFSQILKGATMYE